MKLLFKKVVQHDTRPLAYACEDAITLPQIESKSVGNSDISKDRQTNLGNWLHADETR